MVQILDEVPSFGTTFARNFGAGLSRGAEKGFSLAEQSAQRRSKKLEGRQKLAGKAFRDIPAFLKAHHDIELRPEELNQLEGIYSNLLMAQPDLPEQDARTIALEIFGKHTAAQQENELVQRGPQSRHRNSLDIASGLLGKAGKAIGGYVSPAYEAAKRNPKLLASELPIAGSKLAEMLQEEHDPMAKFLQLGLKKLGFGAPEGTSGVPNSITNMLKKGLRKDLDEGDLEGAERIADIESILLSLAPLPGLASKAASAKRLGAAKPASLASRIAPAESAAAEFSPIKQALQGESSLSGKVTKPLANATELRIARAEPTKKLSPINEIVKQRQTQLKSFPKYSEEIVRDAAEREARRAAKVPKTAVGEAGIAKRIAIAESKLPNIESAYTRATARVRALENQISKTSGDAKKAYTDLYNVAKQELSEAQTDLQRARSNLLGDSEKYTVEEATKRAREKVDHITDAISEGKEVKLSGRDYSPRLIAEAKELSKKKKLSHMKGDDFYNEIHENYLKPYRTRLAKVESDLKANPVMFNHEAREILKKERDVLGKLIQSGEAEQTIHNHKLALREINETKKAADRFAQLKQAPKEPKVSEVANEKMWRNQIKEARTSEERAQVIDQGIESLAHKYPRQAGPILEEGKRLGEIINSSYKEGINSLNDLKSFFKTISEKFPVLSKIGGDILIGVGTAGLDEIFKQTEFPITVTAVASTLGAGAKRGTSRIIANQLAKHVIKKIKLYNAKKEYLSDSPEERRKFLLRSTRQRNEAKKSLRVR